MAGAKHRIHGIVGTVVLPDIGEALLDLLQEIAAFVEERMLELLKARHGVFDLVTGVRCSLTE